MKRLLYTTLSLLLALFTIKAQGQEVLEQVVVTGYSQTKLKRVTGSIGSINAEKLGSGPGSSVTAMMQGAVAGVNIKAISGRPGSASKITIRGNNNFSGNSEPLWVIDGVAMQNEFSGLSGSFSTDNIFLNGIGQLNPNDIQNITILKDAAAAAIYGSRAANGVIVITTKKGQSGKLTIRYNNNFILSIKPSRSLQLMSSAEKIEWEQELWDEFSAEKHMQGSATYPIIGIIGQIRAGAGAFSYMKNDPSAQNEYIDKLKQHDTNWHDIIFRNAFSHQQHLSLSGGNNSCQYYISCGYNHEDGMLLHNNYQRYNLSSKLHLTPSEWIELDLGLDNAIRRSTQPDSYIDPFTYAYFANPYEKPYNDDGSYSPDNTFFSIGHHNGRQAEDVMPLNGFNLLNELNNNSTSTKATDNTAKLSATIRMPKNWKFETLISYSTFINSGDKITEKSTYSAFKDRLGIDSKSQSKLYGNIRQDRAERNSYMARGHFIYLDTFKEKHSLNFIMGAEIRGSSYKNLFVKRYNYDPQTGTSSLPAISGAADEWTRQVERLSGEYFSRTRHLSFYSSADYSFRNKLIINASLRTDGSSNFGSNRQFYPAWSIGAAWHTKYGSFKASYGFTGNSNTATAHQLIIKYLLQQYRNINGTSYKLGTIPSAPNPALGWEKTQDAKIGADIRLLQERLRISTELYYRFTSDVIAPSQVLSTTGFRSVYFNSANICNAGTEISISANILQNKDYSLDISGNFAYNFNKVLKFTPSYGNTITSKDRYIQGYPIGAVITGKYEGIDELSGLYMFRLREDALIKKASDLNNPDNYRYYAGTSIAPFTGGFSINASYKQLSLNIQGFYSLGATVYDKIKAPVSYLNAKHTGIMTETVQTQDNDLYTHHLNILREKRNRWTQASPTDVRYPRIYDYYGELHDFSSYNPMDSNITDAVYLKKVSYLKIKSITLSCNIPEEWCRKIRLSALSLNFSLLNFFTLTDYTGMDPELPGITYPSTRSMSAGLKLTF